MSFLFLEIFLAFCSYLTLIVSGGAYKLENICNIHKNDAVF